MQKYNQWHPNKIHWKKRKFYKSFIKTITNVFIKEVKFLYKAILG